MRERKKVKIYKTTILFIILDLIAAWCFFMMYGPWDKVRNMYVNTAMKTMHHQYFANIFYNQKTIDKIMASNYFISFEEDADTDAIVIDLSLIHILLKASNGNTYYNHANNLVTYLRSIK